MKWLISSFLILNILSCFCQNNQKNSLSATNEVEKKDSLSIYYTWGMQYMMLQNDQKEAIKYFDKYINDQSGREKMHLFEAYVYRAICKRKTSDFIGSLKDLDTIISKNPNYREALYERGNTKLDLGDYNGSTADYAKALKTQKDGKVKDDEIYHALSIAYSKKGNYDLGLENINKAILLAPEFGLYYFVRGTTYWVLMDDEKACLDYSKAGELGYYQAYGEIQEKCK